MYIFVKTYAAACKFKLLVYTANAFSYLSLMKQLCKKYKKQFIPLMFYAVRFKQFTYFTYQSVEDS